MRQAIDDYELRPARPGDEAGLFRLMQGLGQSGSGMPTALLLPDGPHDRSRALWVITGGRALLGFAAISRTPGLPGEYDLSGGIESGSRGRGLGSLLLDYACRQAAALGARRLYWNTAAPHDPAVGFLLARGFTVHHREIILARSLAELPPIPPQPAAAIVGLSRRRAIPLFLSLYRESFAGLPWNQPYTDDEVRNGLASAAELRFISLGNAAADEIVGVAWLHVGGHMSDKEGQIEPIAIRPDYQGRGYGRKLLIAALHTLRDAGVEQATIGTWEQHAAALGLYRGLSFVDRSQTVYLSRDLG